MKSQEKCSITKKIVEKSPTGMTITERYISVEGPTLSQCGEMLLNMWLKDGY